MENTYNNVADFKKWYISAVKPQFKSPDWDDVLVDVAKQYGSSGSSIYEIGGAYTITGNPETYFYKVDTRFFLAGEIGQPDTEVTPNDNDFDFATSTFTF